MTIDTRILAAVLSRAWNESTRELARTGGRLSAEEVEAVGTEGMAWLRSRARLDHDGADDDGGVELYPRRS